MSRALVFIVAFVFACGEKPPSEAELLAPPLGASSGGEAEVVEVRTLTITWSGAEGASEQVSRTEPQAEERAQMISDLLRAPGSNFGEVARSYGDGIPQLLRLRASDTDPSLYHAAVELGIGEVGTPIRTPGGFVVLTRRADPQQGPSSTHVRHILIAYAGASRVSDSVTRTQAEAEALAQSVRERAVAGEDWVELHAANTDEPGSPPGGDLGIVGRGQLVPAFERVAFALAPNEISEVVETSFGYHIIQRVE